MKINSFNDVFVRLETIDGQLFDGEAAHESVSYCEHEYGRAEDALNIDHWVFYRSDIRSVTLLEGPPAFWLGRPLHCMHLAPEPFEKIERGEKTIELRLNDSKRQAIRVGDILRFELTTDGSELLFAEVKALHSYPSFEALYAALPPEKLGYAPDETPDPHDMDAYYSAEAQARYGALGIELALL